MINVFIPLGIYLSIQSFVTMVIAGRNIKFNWGRFLLLLVGTPFISMLWLELLLDRGNLAKENRLLSKKISDLKKNQK